MNEVIFIWLPLECDLFLYLACVVVNWTAKITNIKWSDYDLMKCLRWWTKVCAWLKFVSRKSIHYFQIKWDKSNLQKNDLFHVVIFEFDTLFPSDYHIALYEIYAYTSIY